MNKTVAQEDLNTGRRIQAEKDIVLKRVGELEYQKLAYLKKLDELGEEWAKYSEFMSQKYGDGASINIKTGEIVNGKD
jgi:hypothetical protein